MVEGYSDLHFFAEALAHCQRSGVYIQKFNGKSDLKINVSTFVTPLLLAEKESIGLVVDADDDAASTVATFARVLSEVTSQGVAHGQWTTGKPRVGLYVVPDGPNRPGEIESLVWDAWAADPRNVSAASCVQSYERCMVAAGFEARSKHKGLIGAALAILSDEDPRLGPGARAKVFDFARPQLADLLRFLQGI